MSQADELGIFLQEFSPRQALSVALGQLTGESWGADVMPAEETCAVTPLGGGIHRQKPVGLARTPL